MAQLCSESTRGLGCRERRPALLLGKDRPAQGRCRAGVPKPTKQPMKTAPHRFKTGRPRGFECGHRTQSRPVLFSPQESHAPRHVRSPCPSLHISPPSACQHRDGRNHHRCFLGRRSRGKCSCFPSSLTVIWASWAMPRSGVGLSSQDAVVSPPLTVITELLWGPGTQVPHWQPQNHSFLWFCQKQSFQHHAADSPCYLAAACSHCIWHTAQGCPVTVKIPLTRLIRKTAPQWMAPPKDPHDLMDLSRHWVYIPDFGRTIFHLSNSKSL